MSKIRVLIKAPGRKCNLAEIENSSETFRQIINGPEETITIADGLVCICNEIGKLNGAGRNVPIWGGRDCLVGTVIFCGITDEDFTDISLRDILLFNFVYGVEA